MPEYVTVDEALDAVDRLRESWGWLWLLVAPGRESRVGRAVDEHQAEILAARGMSDRAYRAWNLKLGMSALPPTPAAARLDVVDAQVHVRAMVLQTAQYVAGQLASSYVGGRAGVVESVVDALDWLGGGRQSPWMRECVWRTDDLSGLLLRQGSGLWQRYAAIEHVQAWVRATACKQLEQADETARLAAQVTGERVRRVEHRCPACRGQSLQLRFPGADKKRWSIECVSERCVCTGPGCGCLQRYRVPGRRHVWARGEMEGAHGLATAVAMSNAMAKARRGRLRPSTLGHGGWAERRHDL